MSGSHSPRILFAGGGTGGHLFPGIAVAGELQHRLAPLEIVFAGSEREVERGILSKHAYRHVPLPDCLSTDWRWPLRLAANLWRANRESRRLIRAFAPDVVVGLGGFASAPTVFAASTAGIPVVLLEQNAVAGRATSWLSRYAHTICLSFDETTGSMSSRARQIVTGNPVRPDIAAMWGNSDRPISKAASLPQLLVLGGSQGARAVNELMLRFAETHRADLRHWRVFHQTGAADAAAARSRWDALQLDASVEPFFDDMPQLYRQSEFAVSRAGATSLSEFACAGLPVILVPYPDSVGDHQRVNAQRYESQGAARIVEQLSTRSLAQEQFDFVMRQMLLDTTQRQAMRIAMRQQARPDACVRVAEVVLSLLPSGFEAG